MLWGKIRDRIIQRLGEYNAGAAEAAAQATFTDATIYQRISDVYRELIGDVAEIDPTKVCDITTMSYAADTESVTLGSTVKYRPIHTCELQLTDLVSYEPMEKVTQWQDSRAREWDARTYVPVTTRYAWRIEKDKIYVMPKPPTVLTLRLRYLAEIADITPSDSASSPTVIPSEHHAYMALKVAMTFLNEAAGNDNLKDELNRGQAKFNKWASQSAHRAGPTFVAEPE